MYSQSFGELLNAEEQPDHLASEPSTQPLAQFISASNVDPTWKEESRSKGV